MMNTKAFLFAALILSGCGPDMDITFPSSNKIEIVDSGLRTFVAVTVYRLDSTSASNIYATVEKQDSILATTNVAGNWQADSTFPWTINFLPPLTRMKDSTKYIVRLVGDHTTLASWTVRLDSIEWWWFDIPLNAVGVDLRLHIIPS